MQFCDPRSVSLSDIAVFHDPDPEGPGYLSIYPHHTGAFYAKAFNERVSPYCQLASDAVRYLAAWWKGMYGAAWASIYRGRKTEGWKIIPDKEDGGCRLLVNVVETKLTTQFFPKGAWFLTPYGSTRIVAKPGRSRAADYLTRAEAKDAYNRWVWQTWGIFAEISRYAVRPLMLPPTFTEDGDRKTGSRAAFGTAGGWEQVPRIPVNSR